VLASVCFWAGSVQAQNDDARQVAERVDHHYNALRSMKADFTETYSGGGLELAESGVLYLKKSGKMRWEYTDPRRKLFISDGKAAYFYVPGESEARRASLSKLDDLRSPLRYLLGKTKLEREFESLDLVPGAAGDSNVTLRGKPRSMAGSVQLVDLEIDQKSEIVRIRIEGSDSAVTEFRFSDLTENPSLDDSLFHFIPPPGVQIIAGEELAQ